MDAHEKELREKMKLGDGDLLEIQTFKFVGESINMIIVASSQQALDEYKKTFIKQDNPYVKIQ